jgi:hypothetical protein
MDSPQPQINLSGKRGAAQLADSESPGQPRPTSRELRERPVGNYVNAGTPDQGIT